MLQEVFYWVFNMSIAAVVSGIVVMLIRTVRRIPKRLTVYLWIIPFFRMSVPVGLGSPYSLMSLLSRVATKTVVVYESAGDISLSMTNMIGAAESYFPITYKINVLENVFGIASVIWLAVLLGIIFILSAAYIATMREMKDSRHFHDNIYFSEKIASPAVYGILRPKIVLPTLYADKDIELILQHEKIHIRRADNLKRVLAFLITAVHWFNPFSWLFLKMYLADIELSCDEHVLMKIGDGRARDYALALLASKENANILASNFGGAKIRQRIENILSFKKMTWFSLAAFLALLAAIFYVLLTNAG